MYALSGDKLPHADNVAADDLEGWQKSYKLIEIAEWLMVCDDRHRRQSLL